MATTKLNNGQLPTTLSSKTIDNTNDISTTTTKLKISGGTNGQVLTTDGASNLSWTTVSGGGGISDGDKGDITVSGSGATWTIDNGVVTFAKIQDVTADRLLGRISTTGSTQEIGLASSLIFAGGSLSTTLAADATWRQTATLASDTGVTDQGTVPRTLATLSLSAGTWLILAHVTGFAINLNFQLNGFIRNTSVGNNIASGSQNVAASGTANQPSAGQVSLTSIVTLANTASISVCASRGETTNWSNNFTAAAGVVRTSSSSSGTGATRITAIRLV